MYCRRAALKRMTRDIKEDADGNFNYLNLNFFRIIFTVCTLIVLCVECTAVNTLLLMEYKLQHQMQQYH
jgi:hypothetical protein